MEELGSRSAIERADVGHSPPKALRAQFLSPLADTMRLYHVLPSDYAVLNLKNRRLKIAQYEDLNDPFEMYAFDLSNELLLGGTIDGRSAMNQSFGMLCFTRAWSNPLLWSHYGARHTGVCLGFDVQDGLAREVSYSHERLQWPMQESGIPQDITLNRNNARGVRFERVKRAG